MDVSPHRLDVAVYLAQVAAVVDGLRREVGLSVDALCKLVDPPHTRSTIKRRLLTGDFKGNELFDVARALGTTPAAITQQAEGVAA